MKEWKWVIYNKTFDLYVSSVVDGEVILTDEDDSILTFDHPCMAKSFLLTLNDTTLTVLAKYM